MTATTRNELLAAINSELAKRGLKKLHKLGDATRGEIEVTALDAVFDHSARFFTDVRFDVAFPGGAAGKFTVRFNANGATSDGAVMVPVINGRFALVRQWRLPLGTWTCEVPRGFGEKLDTAQVKGELGTVKIADLPLGTLTRELGEEVMKDAQITSITHLGNIAENSGTHNVVPSYFLVHIKVDEKQLSGKLGGSDDAIKVLLWDSERVNAEFGLRIADSHSITALALAKRHIDSLPKL